MTNHYTAQELIDAAKAYIAADAAIMSSRPAGCPRGAWRMENPIDLPTTFDVHDTAFKTSPKRRLSFDLNGNPYDLWVWSNGKKPEVLERINLRADDANARLARYARD